jgi:hypothetical protein
LVLVLFGCLYNQIAQKVGIPCLALSLHRAVVVAVCRVGLVVLEALAVVVVVLLHRMGEEQEILPLHHQAKAIMEGLELVALAVAVVGLVAQEAHRQRAMVLLVQLVVQVLHTLLEVLVGSLTLKVLLVQQILEMVEMEDNKVLAQQVIMAVQVLLSLDTQTLTKQPHQLQAHQP